MERVQKKRVLYGDFYRPRSGDSGALVVTPKGRKLRSRYQKLVSLIRISPEGRVSFPPAYSPHFAGEGVHARVFTVSPKELSVVRRAVDLVRGGKTPPTLMVKTYRPHPLRGAPATDGISQLMAGIETFNFLKKRKNRFFVPVAPEYFFATPKVLVRRYRRVPRLFDLLNYFDMKEDRLFGVFARRALEYKENPLSEKEMDAFLRTNKITKQDLKDVGRELKTALEGEFLDTIKPRSFRRPFMFDLTPATDPRFEPEDKESMELRFLNTLVLGRHRGSNKLKVMVYDQAKSSIPTVTERLERTTPNPRIRKRK